MRYPREPANSPKDEMRVKVVAPFEIRGLDREGALEVPPGASVRSLTLRFGLAAAYAWLLPVSVNGEVVEKSHILEDGDVVVFIFPIAGG